MANCSNCGKYMDGWGSVCGVCKDNAKIQEGQADMQRQLRESAREAERASERQVEAVQSAKRQARVQHAEAMRAEADRLEELQKQTQILLEGQITNEDAYQRGFDLEDEYLNLLISEDGRVYWEIYEPYLVARLNAAYEKGAQDRLEKEFESNYPGLEYMKQEAFGHGYAGSTNCSIVYLHHLPHIYPAKLNVLTETELIQAINQETGELEWQWMPAYMSEELNDAYDSGAEKYINEQNTAELVASRLQKIANEKKSAEEAIEELERERADNFAVESRRKRRVQSMWAIGLSAIFLSGAGFIFIKNPDLANNPFQTKNAEIGMKVSDLGIRLDSDTAIYRYQKNLFLWGVFDKPGHPIFAIEMRCDGVKSSDQYEQIGGIKCGDSKDKVLKKYGKAAYEVCWDLSDPVTSPIGIFYAKDGFFWGLDKDSKVSSMGKTVRKRYPVDEGATTKCSDLGTKELEVTPISKPVESPTPSASQDEIPPKRNIGEMTITFNPSVDAYYPSFSKRAGEEGSVVVRMIIDEAGSVKDVAILQSSGFPRLDRAGVNIAMDFKFKPSYIAGKPAAVSTNLMIKFNLKDKSS